MCDASNFRIGAALLVPHQGTNKKKPFYTSGTKILYTYERIYNHKNTPHRKHHPTQNELYKVNDILKL